MTTSLKQAYVRTGLEIFCANFEAKRYPIADLIERVLNSRPECKLDKDTLEEISMCFYRNYHTRYKFEVIYPIEEIFKLVFENSYKENPEKMIQAAERLNKKQTMYSAIKKICFIQLPLLTSKLLKHPASSIVIPLGVFVAASLVTYSNYIKFVCFINHSISPFLLKQTPRLVVKLFMGVRNFFSYVHTNRVELALSTLICHQIALSSKISSMADKVKKIGVWDIIKYFIIGEHLILFTFTKSFYHAKQAGQVANYIGNGIEEIVHKEEKIRLAICKEKSYNLWCQAVEEILKDAIK